MQNKALSWILFHLVQFIVASYECVKLIDFSKIVLKVREFYNVHCFHLLSVPLP